jgi:hypothetical protein
LSLLAHPIHHHNDAPSVDDDDGISLSEQEPSTFCNRLLQEYRQPKGLWRMPIFAAPTCTTHNGKKDAKGLRALSCLEDSVYRPQKQLLELCILSRMGSNCSSDSQSVDKPSNIEPVLHVHGLLNKITAHQV